MFRFAEIQATVSHFDWVQICYTFVIFTLREKPRIWKMVKHWFFSLAYEKVNSSPLFPSWFVFTPFQKRRTKRRRKRRWTGCRHTSFWNSISDRNNGGFPGFDMQTNFYNAWMRDKHHVEVIWLKVWWQPIAIFLKNILHNTTEISKEQSDTENELIKYAQFTIKN